MPPINQTKNQERKLSARKMVAYELMKELEELPYFKDLLKQGIVPVNWLDYKVIYEFYLKESDKESGKQLVTNVANEFNISERLVYKIVKRMRD